MGNLKILVVEDNQDNMTLLVDILTSLDYDVVQAVDGVDGLEKAQATIPDLILMDLSLPRLDGWDATRKLKENSELAHIPVLALTAHSMVGDRERALEAGCDDYISKPIKFAVLVEKIDKFVKGE